jgi:hypothetical protein
MPRGSRYEISSVGFDTSLQGVGGDPDNSGYAVGIRVPSAPTISTPNRYFFMLARTRLNAFCKAHLIGIRQMVTIGTLISNGGTPPANYPLEKEVQSPFWKFTDGNVSWHLRRIPPTHQQQANIYNAEGLSYLDSQTPSLLYLNAPTEAGGYIAPNKIPGVPLVAQLGTFYDLRWNWRDDHAFFSLDAEIQGPCDIALFASVRQTNPETRTALVLPGSLPAGTDSIPQEDAFVVNFPTSIYWRIAGALLFQEEEFYPEPRENLECYGVNDGPRPVDRGTHPHRNGRDGRSR